jgi:thiamine-monophosphate kinase
MMKMSDLGEFGLIGRIKRTASRLSASTVIGIGDDAAVLKPSSLRRELVTTDLLLEGVHFDLSHTDFYSLGWKAAAVNLSDIAAMGGIPRFCLVALGIPPRVSVEQIAGFYRGLNTLLRKHTTDLVGGDTCSSLQGLCISVTAIGECEPSRIVTRSGARPGDRVYVTGTLGDSAAGLEILKKRGNVQGRKTRGVKLVDRHRRPMARVEWGRALALSGCVSAMIDLSDGLSSDLSHICEQSRVGADIRADCIPISSALQSMSGSLPRAPLEFALSGGEDYELLCTVRPTNVRKIQSLKIPMTEIGIITPGNILSLVDDRGRRKTLSPSGYDHFRGDRNGRGSLWKE